jgi:hypothetical protein
MRPRLRPIQNKLEKPWSWEASECQVVQCLDATGSTKNRSISEQGDGQTDINMQFVNIVAYRPVAKCWLCKQRPFLGNGSVNTFPMPGDGVTQPVARWREHIPAETVSIRELTSESRVTLRLAVNRHSIHLGVKPLETHDQRFLFQLNPCPYSPYVTSSLTTGWVCCLELLLGLASAVILGSASRGATFYCHRFKTHPIWRVRSPYLYPPGTGWPSYIPRNPVFISPRNRVAQLYPEELGSLFVASYDSQGCAGGIRTPPPPPHVLRMNESELLYDWRLTASIHLGTKPPETHDQYFF